MTPNPLKRPERIWELDAFRGLCILCVIVIHAVFDLRYFAGLNFRLHPVFQFIMDYGGVLFVLLSGICVTLGSHSVRRGAVVFACGLVITGVTEAMIALGMADASVRIQFGVLHLLGFCMMTYPLYRRLPAAAAAGAGVVIGNEANGLRDEIIACCDARVTIPMAGRAESLNAAAAAAILCTIIDQVMKEE